MNCSFSCVPGLSGQGAPRDPALEGSTLARGLGCRLLRSRADLLCLPHSQPRPGEGPAPSPGPSPLLGHRQAGVGHEPRPRRGPRAARPSGGPVGVA